jgi:hypothetical protein
MQIALIILAVILGYIIPGYYFFKWEIEADKGFDGYVTLGTMILKFCFAIIPVVNIILFLIVGVTDEKLFPKRFY